MHEQHELMLRVLHDSGLYRKHAVQQCDLNCMQTHTANTHTLPHTWLPIMACQVSLHVVMSTQHCSVCNHVLHIWQQTLPLALLRSEAWLEKQPDCRVLQLSNSQSHCSRLFSKLGVHCSDRIWLMLPCMHMDGSTNCVATHQSGVCPGQQQHYRFEAAPQAKTISVLRHINAMSSPQPTLGSPSNPSLNLKQPTACHAVHAAYATAHSPSPYILVARSLCVQSAGNALLAIVCRHRFRDSLVCSAFTLLPPTADTQQKWHAQSRLLASQLEARPQGSSWQQRWVGDARHTSHRCCSLLPSC